MDVDACERELDEDKERGANEKKNCTFPKISLNHAFPYFTHNFLVCHFFLFHGVVEQR